MSQTPGVADHAAATPSSSGFGAWVRRARKAVIGFLASGGAAALAGPIADANWSELSLDNLWQGLIAGMVGGVLVYWIRNEAPKLGVSPEVEQSIERLINEKLGTGEARARARSNLLKGRPSPNPSPGKENDVH